MKTYSWVIFCNQDCFKTIVVGFLVVIFSKSRLKLIKLASTVCTLPRLAFPKKKIPDLPDLPFSIMSLINDKSKTLHSCCMPGYMTWRLYYLFL